MITFRFPSINSLLRIFFSSKKSFTGNVLKLATGTAFAQALGILVIPILTRLFSPEAFGIAALFSSIAGILGVVACLRYEFAIMLPPTDEEAANLLGVSLCSVVAVTSLTALVLFLTGDRIVNLLKAPDLRRYLWLIPVSVFFSGTYLALNYWNSRTQHYGRLSLAQIVSSAVSQTSRLAAGFAGYVNAGILIGTTVLGNLVSASLLGGQIWRDDASLFKTSIRKRDLLGGMTRYRKFPLVDIWGGLLNTISWQLPALLLAPFFSITVVGYYALGTNIVRVPMGIIGHAIAQVFYQRVCAIKGDPVQTAALVEGLFLRLVSLSLFPILIMCFIGQDLFALVFGPKWSEAGLYTQILSPWLFFTFISSPLSSLFAVFERQGSALVVHATVFLTRLLSLYIGGILGNVYLALGLFSLTGVFVYGGVALWSMRLASVSYYSFFNVMGRYILYFLPVGIGLSFAKYFLGLPSLILFGLSAMVLSIYFLALISWKNDER